MKTATCFVLILLIQYKVQCKNNHEDSDIVDHSNNEDREHLNEWVVHVPKGR